MADYAEVIINGKKYGVGDEMGEILVEGKRVIDKVNPGGGARIRADGTLEEIMAACLFLNQGNIPSGDGGD